ncbi:MAG: 30S ribosomal protein S20 [Candidatus Dormibacteraceae bacterium]
MANIRSSKKDARRSAIQAIRNRSIKAAVKTQVVKARRALSGERDETAPDQVAAAISKLDRAVAKGVLHRNNAGRRKARLMASLGSPERAASAPAKGTRGAAKSAATKEGPARQGGRTARPAAGSSSGKAASTSSSRTSSKTSK